MNNDYIPYEIHIHEAHKKLRKSKGFALNTINTAIYLSLVQDIAKRRDTKSIPFLLEQFTDKKEYYSVLKQLKVYIEKYYFNEHISELLNHFHVLVHHAPAWAGAFAFEFFKHPIYCEKINEILLCNRSTTKRIISTLNQALISYEASVRNLRNSLKNRKEDKK